MFAAKLTCLGLWVSFIPRSATSVCEVLVFVLEKLDLLIDYWIICESITIIFNILLYMLFFINESFVTMSDNQKKRTKFINNFRFTLFFSLLSQIKSTNTTPKIKKDKRDTKIICTITWHQQLPNKPLLSYYIPKRQKSNCWPQILQSQNPPNQ